MPENEPNGTPAATDPAGQRPTTDGNDPQQPTNDGAASGQQPNDGQQQPTEEIRDPVAKARAEAEAKYRTQLRDAQRELATIKAEREAAQRAAEEADMSELQKAQRRLAEYQAQEAQWTMERQQWRLSQSVQMHAARLGIVDADAASKLLDTSALEYDENGQPTNTEALLTAMLEQRPWLRGAQTSTTTNTPTTPAASTVGATNPQRQVGPLTITPSQYSDTAFRAQYMRDYGEDVLTAINKGKVKIV